MELVKVIQKPYVTEKTQELRNSEKPVITFVVDPKANKHLIKKAFIAIYSNIKPEQIEKINVVVKKPARIRTGTIKPGYTKYKKIAYITLVKGTEIAISAEEAEENAKNKK